MKGGHGISLSVTKSKLSGIERFVVQRKIVD